MKLVKGRANYIWTEGNMSDQYSRSFAYNFGVKYGNKAKFYLLHDLDILVKENFFIELFENMGEQKCIQPYGGRRVLYMSESLTKKVIEKEIDFNNLPNDCYINAYIPKCIKIEDTINNSLKEKFGGKYPFFVKGEKWPIDQDGIPMVFCCQFKDPRKKDNILYRVFINIDEPYGICEDCWINKIEMSPQNIKKQIIIKKPEYSEQIKKKIELEHIELENIFKPFEIIEWKKNSEIKSFSKIMGEGNPPSQESLPEKTAIPTKMTV
jgi:hypothetical protein